ncbi:MAG: 50S ribosomal protein L17 [Dehalococcoidia bacterium]|jgi:large subunit ribosomal protein L17|nr:MAG: 50S ribosomal protein L17 [Dehalococcoidia bacterium]
MRHKLAGRKLNRWTGHRWALYRNQVTALLAHERIVTTEAKAKEVRSLAEKMITLGKDGSLASRREALSFVTDKRVVDKLFAEIAPSYADRNGGYTRLLKLGPRPGDSAPMAQIELVK